MLIKGRCDWDGKRRIEFLDEHSPVGIDLTDCTADCVEDKVVMVVLIVSLLRAQIDARIDEEGRLAREEVVRTVKGKKKKSK